MKKIRISKDEFLNKFNLKIVEEKEISKAASALGSIRTAKKSASSRANGARGGRPKNNWVEKIFTDYPLTAKNTLENLSNGEFDWEKLSESDKQIHAKQAYEILSESE